MAHGEEQFKNYEDSGQLPPSPSPKTANIQTQTDLELKPYPIANDELKTMKIQYQEFKETMFEFFNTTTMTNIKVIDELKNEISALKIIINDISKAASTQSSAKLPTSTPPPPPPVQTPWRTETRRTPARNDIIGQEVFKLDLTNRFEHLPPHHATSLTNHPTLAPPLVPGNASYSQSLSIPKQPAAPKQLNTGAIPFTCQQPTQILQPQSLLAIQTPFQNPVPPAMQPLTAQKPLPQNQNPSTFTNSPSNPHQLPNSLHPQQQNPSGNSRSNTVRKIGFLGDSHFSGIAPGYISRRLGGCEVLKFDYKGATVPHLTLYSEVLLANKPTDVVIHVGCNDIWGRRKRNVTSKQIAQEILQFVQKCKRNELQKCMS